MDEYNASMGAATQTDRRSLMQQLYEAYLACPWAWASVNAIARTITAGGLVTDWDNDDGEGDDEQPDKPANVLALERLLAYCNPTEDIRQILRNVITDLEVFGDAFIEVVWMAGIPVALYNLDCPTVTPRADEHGKITGYVQVTDFGQRAEFEPEDVIHISLDAPRSGIFGISPTQAAMLPITSWLFAASTGKEMFRKGLPPTVHANFSNGASPAEMNRWRAQVAQQNIGARNIGTPWVTKGVEHLNELQTGKITDVQAYKDQARDETIACYGVPPAKLGIIESGNLGGGTGESQDKTFRVNTCQPIAELVLEKLNFHIAKLGFGIEGWSLKFGEVDMRDSKTVEEIRDTRVRNGTWTVNRARVEIGEPPVEGGDEAVIIDRQNMVLVRDLEAASQAGIAQKLRGTALEPGEPQQGQAATVEKPEPAPVPDALAPFAGQDNPPQPPGEPSPDGVPQDGKPPVESLLDRQVANYQARLREALTALPGIDERAA
jgi:HK97 family phage portal protein